MLLSFLLLMPRLMAAEIQLESARIDNPDKIFLPVTRSAFVFGPTLEHKAKQKYSGIFFLVRSKLEYKHDTEANRLRKGEASSTLLAIKPLKNMLLGASLSAGHLWRWRRDFNVISDRILEIDGDHFFLETRMFGEKKLSGAWVLEGGITGRVEDYASSYSVYVNEQNDNLSATVNTALGYKTANRELKPSVSYSRKWWRERRALSSQGFFVGAGEELTPDRIDTFVGSLKGLVRLPSKAVIELTPSWTQVTDLNNDGRSWRGAGAISEIILPLDQVTTKLRGSWVNRVYDSQLSSFQSSGNKGLEDEMFTVAGTASMMVGSVGVELMHSIERTTSNQTDTKDRKIGRIKSTTTALNLKHTF